MDRRLLETRPLNYHLCKLYFLPQRRELFKIGTAVVNRSLVRRMIMSSPIIKEVVERMLPYLNNVQCGQLEDVLQNVLSKYDLFIRRGFIEEEPDFLNMFLSAKKLEGCSEKSLRYYGSTLQKFLMEIGMAVREIDTDSIRRYLTAYQKRNDSGKTTIDNIRRILSSFFSWLEDENYILKSPVRRIHKIKTGFTVKETFSDEELEIMRDSCVENRDLAIIDLLASSGMRIGEMVSLNRQDIDFYNRECIVCGKGEKERTVYFDARTKIHLQKYLDQRSDNDPALFVSLRAPYHRISIGGIETRLRSYGLRLNINKVHPHKFRRTLATHAIDKGMPIEQLQQLLGHKRIDTTLH